MNSYQLLSKLVDLVQQFELKSTDQNALSIDDFSAFLNTRLCKQKMAIVQADIRFGNCEKAVVANAYQIDNNIGRLFIYMSRYAKSYIKKALLDTSLTTAEDFTSLAVLLTHTSLSKTELMQFNLLEKTSGTEVIKRLMEAELISQWDDPADKRGKRIAITQKGKNLLMQVFGEMNHVGKIIAGDLNQAEKLNLQYLLQRLDNFHYNLHQKRAIASKTDLAFLATAMD